MRQNAFLLMYLDAYALNTHHVSTNCRKLPVIVAYDRVGICRVRIRGWVIRGCDGCEGKYLKGSSGLFLKSPKHKSTSTESIGLQAQNMQQGSGHGFRDPAAADLRHGLRLQVPHRLPK